MQTSSATIELLIGGLKKIMDRKEVENVNIIFSEITGNAFIIISDYYTAPVTLQEFNDVKQTINLQSLKLMEELKIEIAGANMDVRIIQ